MSASSPLVRVLLLGVGGPGSLAGALADGMLHDKYRGKLELAVFSRALTADATDAKKAAVASLTSRGVKVINGDATQGAAAVAPLFKGFDAVVSSIGTAGMKDQRVYIEAAKQAGVRWFIPSTFGFDYEVPDKDSTLALLADPKAEDLAAIKAAGMDWTTVNTVSSRAMQLCLLCFFLVPGRFRGVCIAGRIWRESRDEDDRLSAKWSCLTHSHSSSRCGQHCRRRDRYRTRAQSSHLHSRCHEHLRRVRPAAGEGDWLSLEARHSTES